MIQIDDGFFRLATDFEIKPAEYGCDMFSGEERPKEIDEAAQKTSEAIYKK